MSKNFLHCNLLEKHRLHGLSSLDSFYFRMAHKVAVFTGKILVCIFCIEVLEEWAMPASYDLGLETERAALEKSEKQIIQQEQVTFICHSIKSLIKLFIFVFAALQCMNKVKMTSTNDGAVVKSLFLPSRL